jgi:hypothetical protein
MRAKPSGAGRLLAVACMVIAFGCSGSSPTPPLPGGPSSPFTAAINPITPSGTALVGAALTLTAQAVQVSPTPTYTWQFGDGSQGAGQTVTHTYPTAPPNANQLPTAAANGSFTITLTIASGSQTATTSQSFTVGNLTGCWVETKAGANDGHNLTHTQSSLAGTFTRLPTNTPPNSWSLNGSVTGANTVHYAGSDRSYDLTVDSAFMVMTGLEHEVGKADSPVTLNFKGQGVSPCGG